MKRLIIECDQCGSETTKPTFAIFDAFSIGSILDLCGQECLLKYLSAEFSKLPVDSDFKIHIKRVN